MGEIRYFLNKSKGTPETRPIMLSYHFNGQRLFYYTGKKADQDHFNPEAKSPVTSGEDRVTINGLLKILRATIGEIENKAKAGGEPLTADYIRSGLNEKIKAKPKTLIVPNKITLLKYFDMYLKEMETKINMRTGRKLSKTMPQKYTNLKNTFLEFCEFEKKEYDFEDIDGDFYNRFVNYLINEKKYSVNTYGRAIKFFKTIIYDATNKGYNKNFTFMKALRGVTEEADSIFLTETELETIYKKDFSAEPRLDRVRDMFIIGCWTGLRYSDYSTIKPEDVRDSRIRVLTQKTGQRVVIPLHPTVKEILTKYNFELPTQISNDKFNEYIKEVAKKAELKDIFVRRLTKAGVTLKTSKEKHEFVTTHTARRSFATNMFIKGVPAIVIMGITGHKSEKEFLKYIKVSEEQKADLFQKYVNW